MDFASSKGKSMILNKISSAMVIPFVHESEKEVLGVVWLDSESLAQFQPKDLEVVTSVAGQAAMFLTSRAASFHHSAEGWVTTPVYIQGSGCGRQ